MMVAETATQLIDNAPNSAQRYLTHGIFRYFGKYPPTSTRMLLEELWERGATGPVTDVMCGSGTTLLETLLSGKEAVGLDVNPISVLISKVKTEQSDKEQIYSLLQEADLLARTITGTSLIDDKNLFTKKARIKSNVTVDMVKSIQESVTARVGKWFETETSLQHALLAAWLHTLNDSPEKRAILLGWLRTIRASSRASNRTGRLFLDKQKTPARPFDILIKKICEINEKQKSLPNDLPACTIVQASAMKIPNSVTPITTVFWHPPYFALYKYSSDVLRLELEWCQIDRKQLVSEEIRDGFKTSNPEDVEKYLLDCKTVWSELYEACAPNALGIAINSDATLAKKKLDIIDNFAAAATDSGFVIEKLFCRPTMHTQSTYHKSSEDIKTKEDYVILFRKPY